MNDFFQFSDLHKVKKKLGKEQFLRSANLTDIEKNVLAQCIKDIQIQYDIKLPDNSEVVVIGVDVGMLKNKYTSYEIALLVSKSIPYESLIVQYYYEFIYLYSFNMRAHRIDPCKRVNKDFSIHGSFMSDNKRELNELFSSLNKCVQDATHASGLTSMWRQILNNYTGKSNLIK